MASFGRPRVLGRAIVLIILILVLAIGGIAWFDFLGVVDAKGLLSPAYRLLGIGARGQAPIPADSPVLLEEERMAKRLESLQARAEELDQREGEVARLDAEVGQKAQELEERGKALDDKEKSFNEKVKQYDNRKVNVEQNAVYLSGMPPAKAVEILKAMEDQAVIDILRAVEERAKASGESSIVAYWLSLMPPDRSAAIQRKMTAKPSSLD